MPHIALLLLMLQLGQATQGTDRAKINDDWTFEMVGLAGPLCIRPTGRPEWP